MAELVAQVGQAWNRILEDLQSWQELATAFAHDVTLPEAEQAA